MYLARNLPTGSAPQFNFYRLYRLDFLTTSVLRRSTQGDRNWKNKRVFWKIIFKHLRLDEI